MWKISSFYNKNLENYNVTSIADTHQIAKKRKSTLKVSFTVNVPYKASEAPYFIHNTYFLFSLIYILFSQMPYCFSSTFNCFSAFVLARM
jgi:hypothetical protein